MKVEIKFIIASLMASVVNAATTKSVTTLTYINQGSTFTRTMTPPSSVKTMKLVCSTTTNTNKEYCTEVYDTKQKDIVFDCYNLYNRYKTVQDNQTNFCYVYTQKYRTLTKTKEVCSDYSYIDGLTVTSDILCRTKLARYNDVEEEITPAPTEPLVPLQPGYTYTYDTISEKKLITFPVPEKVTDITINCEPTSSISKDEKPTSVPFSIINQEISTMDNPDFTATTVKSTRTVVNDVTTKSSSINGNIYMGEIVTNEEGEITTKVPIAYASLIYCDKSKNELCYGAYAVTDACTIYTRTAGTKVVPKNIYASTTDSQNETPDITITDMEYITITKTKKTTETEKPSITKTQEKETQPAEKCKNVYEQCGGIGYSGPTCCVNSKCIKLGDYYHQCQP